MNNILVILVKVMEGFHSPSWLVGSNATPLLPPYRNLVEAWRYIFKGMSSQPSPLSLSSFLLTHSPRKPVRSSMQRFLIPGVFIPEAIMAWVVLCYKTGWTTAAREGSWFFKAKWMTARVLFVIGDVVVGRKPRFSSAKNRLSITNFHIPGLFHNEESGMA